MIRQFRGLQRGEFFVCFVDCAQGGLDSNYGQFMSKSRADVPLVMQIKDVAANMTPVAHSLLEYIYDKTGVKPVVAFERNNGGASEMERLSQLNREQKYTIYQMKGSVGTVDGAEDTFKLGFDTTAATRPQMLGDLKQAIDSKLLRIYDQETVDQLGKFIVNKRNRAEAAANSHDDAVMSLAGAWQLYQTESEPVPQGQLKYWSPSWTKK